MAIYDGREPTEADVIRDGEQEHDRVLAQSSRGTCIQCYNLLSQFLFRFASSTVKFVTLAKSVIDVNLKVITLIFS